MTKQMLQLNVGIQYEDGFHADGSTKAIRQLRNQLLGRVPRHGTKDGPIPALRPVTILCKQVCTYMRMYGGWPK